MDERWLVTVRHDCKVPADELDDPIYPSTIPYHVEVSDALTSKLDKACAKAGL